MPELTKKPISAGTHQSEKTLCFFLNNQFCQLVGQWVWDLQTEAVFCSDVLMEMPVGFTGTRSIFYPDDVPYLKDTLATAGPMWANLSFRIITTYGQVKTVEGFNIKLVTTVSKPLPEGAPLPLPATAQVNLLMEENRHLKLQLLVQQSAEAATAAATWYHHTASGKTWYADAVYHLHGIDPKTVHAHLRTFLPFIHPNDQELVLQFTDRALTQQIPLHIIYRIETANGAKTVRYSTNWIFSERGEAILCGFLQDVTLQRELEVELENHQALVSYQKQQLAFDEQHVGMGHWQVNLLTRKTAYSDNYYRLFGIKPGSAPAHINTFINYVHPDDKESVMAVYKKMIYEHLSQDVEFRIIRPDGKTRFISQKGRMMMYGEEMLVTGLIEDITVKRILEQKVAAQNEAAQLKNAEQQQAFEMTNTASWVLEVHTGNINWSNSIYKLLGYKNSNTNLTQKAFQSFVHPHDVKRFNEKWAGVLRQKTESVFSFRLLLRGTERHMKAVFRILEHNQQEYFIGTIQDNTLQNLLQQQLANRVLLAENVTENLIDRVLITDVNNTIVLWSRSCEKAYGFKKETALGQNFFDLFPKRRTEEETQLFARALRGHKVEKNGCLAGNGKEYDNLSLIPLVQNGEVTGLLHLVQDVTRETEKSNHLSFIESIIQSLVDRVIVLDNQMNYLYWNKKAEEQSGLTKEQVLGKNILEVYPKMLNEPSFAELRRALRGEPVYLPVNPQEDHYFENYLLPIKGDAGAVIGVLWLTHDLSKQWEMQQAQQRTHL